MSIIMLLSPYKEEIQQACASIMQQRQNVGFLGSFCLAIPCGMLMYAATATKDKNIIYTILCVSAFILGGFYHCVADMFYTLAGATTWPQYFNLIFVTLGNFIGCNIIPWTIKFLKGYNPA